jgi:serine/threonine protein kinase
VHRDIKPENVLFTSDGHCKMVSCFGSCRLPMACIQICFALYLSIRFAAQRSLTRPQADFGLSTSDADRVVMKPRMGLLQVWLG